MSLYILAAIVIFVPISLSIVTQGKILPSLNNHETWTIEYLPMIITSVIGIVIAYTGLLKTKRKPWFYAIAAFNALLGLIFLAAIVYLWGEKF